MIGKWGWLTFSRSDRYNYKVEKAAKPRIMTQQQESESIIDRVKIPRKQEPEDTNYLYQQTSHLHNFLEPYQSFISKLIAQLKDDNGIRDADDAQIINRILIIIQCISKAKLVCLLNNDNKNNWFIKSQTNLIDDVAQNICIEIVKSNIISTIKQESVFDSMHHGFYEIYEGSKGNVYTFVIVPLISPQNIEIMVVCCFEPEPYILGNAYGRILSTFYKASQKFPLQPALVEAAIIDDLKKDFGFVGTCLYERRLQLFREHLQRMVVYFEPVLHLDPADLFISGWEALARDPDSLTAPYDLFQSAELWGSKFTTELDQYFLIIATRTYLEARKKSKQARADDIKPLSVNVYPDSLMRKTYFETVCEILKDKIIQPRNLILEISEKAPLPMFPNGMLSESPIEIFKKKLLEYVKLKIRFAIDDFGVGFASVSRLAGLHPSHVKIDREILHHQHSDVIIRFVHELVGANNLNPSHVIVEGVDETVPISLYQLKEIGVSYIQGYIVGKPSPEIYRLSQEKADSLTKLLVEKKS